jgi:UDP-glucuronate decarboxylase
MTSSHKTLLNEAVSASGPLTGRLKDLSLYVTGASGFLAASLLVFLSEVNRRERLNLRLYASARRPMEQVPLFSFLDLRPEVEWEVAPVETAGVPAADRLVVIHTASYGSPRDYLRQPMETFEANTEGLIHLFQQCESSRVKQFVYFSSAEIYGQPPDAAIPTPEDYVGGLETLAPRSIYGESKRMSEVLGVCLGQARKIPFAALRPWNVYGPGQRLEDGRVPIEFIRQARQQGTIRLASNGSPRRAFCYVWDGIRQIVGTLADQTAPVQAFNIGNSTEEISILELARLCAVASGLPANAVQFDAGARATGLARCAPDTRAVQNLTCKPWSFTPLTSGLRELCAWVDYLAGQ